MSSFQLMAHFFHWRADGWFLIASLSRYFLRASFIHLFGPNPLPESHRADSGSTLPEGDLICNPSRTCCYCGSRVWLHHFRVDGICACFGSWCPLFGLQICYQWCWRRGVNNLRNRSWHSSFWSSLEFFSTWLLLIHSFHNCFSKKSG